MDANAGPVAPPGGADVSLLARSMLSFTVGVQALTSTSSLGYMLSYFLFGILCVQIYFYHIAFPRDSIWLKLYGIINLRDPFNFRDNC
ncbi:hypothetical protein BDV98DRAFT_591842 [Pterulicium gracile]|uniref:Uncharacterized protein n=1 Tax=Pterulicium gracile TaxID=1884261 RepID=A0A5C3QXE5_9AGAR|nr:hypothetical protein BDV98DRAFT_591842 [Pterula gracilis]